MLTGFRKALLPDFSRTPLFWIASFENLSRAPGKIATCARSKFPHSDWFKLYCAKEPDMRKEPLLTAVPPVPVQSLAELYAIAFDQAQKAAQQYGTLATQTDEQLRAGALRLRGTCDTREQSF